MIAKKFSELEKLGMLFIATIIIFRILFLNETWAALLKAALTAHYMFILPAIGFTYLFRGLNFIERVAASIAISASLLGISSYYLGIFGLHIKYSSLILPAVFALPSAIIMLKSLKKIDNNAP